MSEEKPQTRSYDSSLRRRRAAETRQRIVIAGAELLHEYPSWNWRELTVRSVAKRAGVNERTVYRYFPGERELRDAVLGRLEGEADVDIDDIALDEVTLVGRKMLEFVALFPVAPRVTRDATQVEGLRRQREALLRAVGTATRDWRSVDRRVAAAMFYVLWGTVNYERLVTDWELDSKDAIRGIIWVMDLVENAIREDRRPRFPRRR